MTQSLTTSKAQEPVSEKKLGKLKDLLTPVLRRYLKTEDQAQALIESPAFVEGFDTHVKALVGKLTNIFMVTVDYARSLSEMIAAGKYGYANEDITAEHFPITGEGKVDAEILLVHLNRDISSENALAELDKLGLRAANLQELLAFGETHSEVQREFPIIALGSIWQDRDGDRYVPYLDDWLDERRLFLRWFGFDWSALCRFAAVRK